MPHADGDKYDGLYRSWLERQGPAALDAEWRKAHLLWRHRALLRRYPPSGKRVLDFGCMDGIFTLRLQELGGDAVGYDVSPAAIRQAERFRGGAAGPRFTTIPPPRGAFDLVYCQEVIEHVEDDSALVEELVSYLAPGGSVVGTTPVGRYFWDPDHRHFYDEGWNKLRIVAEPMITRTMPILHVFGVETTPDRPRNEGASRSGP